MVWFTVAVWAADAGGPARRSSTTRSAGRRMTDPTWVRCGASRDHAYGAWPCSEARFLQGWASIFGDFSGLAAQTLPPDLRTVAFCSTAALGVYVGGVASQSGGLRSFRGVAAVE